VRIGTFEYVRDGMVVFTGHEQTDLAPHDFAERHASGASRFYADEVWVRFSYRDEGDPDAIAEVSR
jgi:hypothetical protein